ncbi:MAG TPA: hypothetical protein VIT45_01615 [Allosphingosinicella sp.]
MLEHEASRLCRILLGLPSVSPLLNLGSSTARFRETVQPHIERDLFAPLREAGVEAVHCDLKAGAGVDVAGDVLDPETAAKLKARGFGCILVANLLEHVRDREALVRACEEIAGPGGLILATVPSSYPYHADPFDSRYRPSPQALAAAFGRSETLLAEEIVGPTYAEELRAAGSSAWKAMAATAIRLPIAWARPKSFASRLHRWRWYRRPYRVSIALVRVL